MKPLNIVEIEEKIVSGLKEVKTPEDLKELQSWVRKAKKQKVVEPTATSFKKVYYTFYTGRGYRQKVVTVNGTSFVFLGIEVNLPEEKDIKYLFPETDFNSHRIWIDRRIKYGGTEYFPKKQIDEIFGFNLKELFFSYLIGKDFFILKKETYKGIKTYYLLNSESNARKVLHGRRLTQFDLCNNPVVKISKEHLPFLSEVIKIKNIQ